MIAEFWNLLYVKPLELDAKPEFAQRHGNIQTIYYNITNSKCFLVIYREFQIQQEVYES